MRSPDRVQDADEALARECYFDELDVSAESDALLAAKIGALDDAWFLEVRNSPCYMPDIPLPSPHYLNVCAGQAYSKC